MLAMRRSLTHEDLTYPGHDENSCSGIVRRMYVRDPGTRDEKDRKINQKWTRTEYLLCDQCGMVFRREAQGSGEAEIMVVK